MTNPNDAALVERIARAIAIQIYHDEGLETMNYTGESDYADREWRHYEATARAALAIAKPAIVAEMRAEWQPIETAPKGEDVWILTSTPGHAIPIVASWDEEDQEWVSFNMEYEKLNLKFGKPEKWEPTHWQPLPNPPSKEPKE